MATRKKTTTKKAPNLRTFVNPDPEVVAQTLEKELRSAAEKPENSRYREALMFVANSRNALELVVQAYNTSNTSKPLWPINGLFVELCEAAVLRQRFIANFGFRFEGIPFEFLQRFFSELHSKINHRTAVNMTTFYQKDGNLSVHVSVDACALSLRSVGSNMSTYKYLLEEAHNIKADLEKFIRDLPWLMKIEKLENEIRDLRLEHPKYSWVGGRGMMPFFVGG